MTFGASGKLYELTVIGHGFSASSDIQAHHIFIDTIRELS